MATVPEIITSQQTAANNYITQAAAFIDSVAESANTQFDINIPAALGFGLADYADDALDKINNQKPVRPDFSSIEALSPTAPVVSFSDIDQSILDAAKAKVLADLQNGGYGIEPDDEAALWQRERDREAQNGEAEAEEIRRQFAEGGFPIPTGAMFNAMSKSLGNAQAKNSSVNRDIALRRSELYVENRKFSIQNAQSIEQVLIALHRAVTEQVLATTSVFDSQLRKYRADVDADVEIIKANLGVYAADVQAFIASIRAIGEAYTLKTQEQQLNNNWNVEVVKTRLEEARIRLLGDKYAADIRTSASRFGAEYYLGVISAALGSINTLAAQTEAS